MAGVDMIVSALVAVIVSMFLIGISAVAEMRHQNQVIEQLRQAVKYQENMIGIQRSHIAELEKREKSDVVEE